MSEGSALQPSHQYLECLTVYLTPEARTRLAACIALRDSILEVANVAPEVMPVKLAWWQEELQRLANDVPRHPATTSLYQSMSLNADALALVDEWLVLARRHALNSSSATETDLEIEAFREHGTTLLLSLFDESERLNENVITQVRSCALGMTLIDHTNPAAGIDPDTLVSLRHRVQTTRDITRSLPLAVLNTLIERWTTSAQKNKQPKSLALTMSAWRAARRWHKRNT